MRATIRYFHDQLVLPDDVKLGDSFVFTATAIVTSLEQTLEDVTSYGRDPKTDAEVIPGDQSATVTITNLSISHRTPA